VFGTCVGWLVGSVVVCCGLLLLRVLGVLYLGVVFCGGLVF